MEIKIASQKVVACWKSFCLILASEKNLKRDIYILVIMVVFLAGFLGTNWQKQKKIKETQDTASISSQEENLTEEESVQKEKGAIVDIQKNIDMSAWKPYQNTWYGFSLRYPDTWQDPIVEKSSVSSSWEQKVSFRLSQNDEKNPFEGFDVVSYNIFRIKQLTNVEEFPKLKSQELKAEGECASIDGHLLETGDYPAEEVYVPAKDACFNATLFFTNTRGNYIYTIVPKLRDGWGLAGDPSQEIKDHLPEFFGVVATWELTDIQRPKPIVATPRINAPMPVSFDRANGKLVCNKKNDHPGKSDKHKGKHMDMECCLDPDEYPNPHCYYPESKYGKYL